MGDGVTSALQVQVVNRADEAFRDQWVGRAHRGQVAYPETVVLMEVMVKMANVAKGEAQVCPAHAEIGARILRLITLPLRL